MGQGLGVAGGLGDFGGGKAALGLFAADIHLQKDVLDDAQLFGGFLDLIQQGQRAHGLDQRRLAHHLLDLVALEMADEVQRCAVVGIFRELPGHLLNAVFAQGINAGGDGLPAGGGVVHFAGAHQGDVRTGAAGFGGGGFDSQADGRNVFGYGHGKFLPFYFCWWNGWVATLAQGNLYWGRGLRIATTSVRWSRNDTSPRRNAVARGANRVVRPCG